MPVYSVLLTGSGANSGDWMAEIDEVRKRIGDAESILTELVEKVILPALARNYNASGLKVRTGMLFDGITKRGARGNYVRNAGMRVTVGVDYSAIPYAKAQIEGSPPHDIVARRARFLHFFIDGKEIFVKRVHHPGTKAHAIYYLTDGDLAKARQIGQARIDSSHMAGVA